VITDGLMPAMDGYELVRHLRLTPATRESPVVFDTAHYGQHEARTLALSSGVSYVLTKPAASAEVLTLVGRVLSGELPPGVVPESSSSTTSLANEPCGCSPRNSRRRPATCAPRMHDCER
jgi:DNA-binding response OmpR family regulator